MVRHAGDATAKLGRPRSSGNLLIMKVFTQLGLLWFIRTTGMMILAALIPALAVAAQAEQTPSWAKVSQAQIDEANRLGVPVAFTNGVGIKFVLIPPGKFMMGSRDSEAEVARRCMMPNAQAGWFYDEHPRHEVTITSAFYMAVHEVTQAEYKAIPKPKDDNTQSKDSPDEFLGENKPVVYVSWQDAEEFCKALSRKEAESGRVYALPTEAQWEYACRAGGTTPFSFGETVSTDQANYDGDYTYGDGIKGENRGRTLRVGSLPANAWGLYDMHGNVSEWCADWYDEYHSLPASDPLGPDKSDPPNQRDVRGGSWRSYPGACRSACRLRGSFNAKSNNVGFRVCCALPAKTKKGE